MTADNCNGSIKKNLELLFHKSASLTPRKRKEIEKGFEEAYSFFLRNCTMKKVQAWKMDCLTAWKMPELKFLNTSGCITTHGENIQP